MTVPSRSFHRSRWFLLLLVCLAAACVEPEEEEGPALQDRELRLALAGRGDPWSHLTAASKPIFLALHDGLSAEETQRGLGLGPDSLAAELHGLEAVGLVKTQGDQYLPDFFLANREEAESGYAHARLTGEFLAEEVAKRWLELEGVYDEFTLGEEHPFHDMAFVLVGGRILDMGVLGALVDEGSLLAPAPTRPSPGWPDGRYYFWGVEAGHEYLGRYGENSSNIGDTKWTFLTFGSNFVNGRPNGPRNDLEDRFEALLEARPHASPAQLAEALAIPFLSRHESEAWMRTSGLLSADLVRRLLEGGPDIPAFFQSLRAGSYAADRRAEFMVWYYHMAYAWAIDALVERGFMTLPADEYLSLLLYLEEEGGVLKGF